MNKKMIEQESQEDSIDNSIRETRHKIIFVGATSSGKSSIINRIIDNSFHEPTEIQVGIDWMNKNIRFRGQNIKIQIWDSNGQEKYKGLIPSYVRNSSIAFCVYDTSERFSFDSVIGWISYVKSVGNVSMIVLCGNKIDLERKVEKKEGEELAKKENISFFECSAKTNDNIKNMFYSSIAGSSIFGVYDEYEKYNVVKELIEENEVEESKEEGSTQNLHENQKGKLNVNGKMTSGNIKRKKKCGCQYFL